MFDKWGREQKIFALGDIHGKWQIIRYFYEKHKKNENFSYFNREDNVIILLGDAGLNYFFNHRDTEAKTKLSSYPFTYFLVRGNHEERPSVCAEKYPDKWHTEEFWGNTVYVENDYPHIKYALDEVALYHIPYITGYCEGTEENEYNDEGMPYWDFYKALVIPGAYSVDKHHRLTNGWSWFEGEQLTQEEMIRGKELINRLDKVDFIFSHTCPIIFEPTDLFLSCVDQSMVDKSMERYLGGVEFNLDYRSWMWGHYHAFRDYPRTDGRKKLMLFNGIAVNIKDYLEWEEYKKYSTC
jgi:3-oxoacid CoA-transferase subunit A